MQTETLIQEETVCQGKRTPRGIFEKIPNSDVWWVRYHDSVGKLRREKAGTRGMAAKLYAKRKTEALQKKKLPETIRHKAILFRDLVEDAVTYAREHHQSTRERDYRADLLIELFGGEPADSITPQQIDRQLSRVAREREWAAASYNRFKAFVSLAYRLAIENDKMTVNPARLVRRRREDNGVIRWLTADEEKKLRAVIEADYPGELPAFDLGLHTGMRRSEQYRLAWERVDLLHRQITIPRSKHGGIRYVPLDNTALSALLALRKRGNGKGPVMVLAESGHGYEKGHALSTPKEWFVAAVAKAGIADFTWHCLRHTFASRLVMAGVDLRKVQELMGHKTIAMTCRYSHLAPQHLQDAVSKLDGWADSQKAILNRDSGNESDTKTDTGALVASQAPAGDVVEVTVQ
jgi:site-specific recombinase XerD